ncbi:asparagine synthase (glutamine-hydrolysing) [Novosphingobium sp. PhB55]|uniref:asparagine synthase-related protein n=1 Tax=Novosphingobium sp. PhB55 TaxID=2485106 RepID=UPI0010DECCEE|nr:asparagine synthetase B family protein [Novosphingobium sp. PhB55]TDW61557.1 asparagine synthase (glutamine-hydrolysing) [Novosphingobium sp. PhB55]
MIRARYLAGIHLSPGDQVSILHRARNAGLKILTDRPGFMLATDDGLPVLALGALGVVVGELYAPGRSGHLEALGPDEIASIAGSAGRRLAKAYWGDYVAFLHAGDETAIVRSPFGRLPCLTEKSAGAFVAASDLDMLQLASAIPPGLDHAAIARQLMAGSMRHARTCIAGVEEVQGGDRLTISARDGARREALWSPWTFVQPERAIYDEQDAVTRLRHQAVACIRQRTSRITRPLLMLSGGLDSSVTAACLAESGRDFDCLNLMTASAAGDEREYARSVAGHLGRRLVERTMEGEIGGFERLAAVRLPRPVARSFEQHLYSLSGRIAEEMGCDAVIDGGAGDNVFGSLQSASPAADCLLDPAGSRYFRRLCSDIGELAHASRWKVAWRARRRALAAKRPYRWQLDTRFLSAAARELEAGAGAHPWIDDNSVHLPGRAAHIAMLVAAQGVAEDGPRGAKSKVISPLLSQPLVEHCLSVPSWFWFAGGRNRAAARRAFEGYLPHEIAWRRSKGAPDSFVIGLFEKHRATLRDYLAGGLLAQAGTIDLVPILKIIDDPRPVGGTGYGRIMEIFDAEVWAREVTSR